MPIGDSYKTNFETIREAAKNNDLCLMEVYDRLTGEPAVLLCAGYVDEEEQHNIIPLAQMCAFNPYEKFVMELEDVAKYYAVGESIARAADRSFIDTVKDNPFVDSLPARAFALLNDHLENSGRAHALTPLFIKEVLSKVGDEWNISAKELDSWVEHAENPNKEQEDGESSEAAVAGEAPEAGA